MNRTDKAGRQRWRRRERIVTIGMAVMLSAIFFAASWIVRLWMSAGPIVDMRL